MNELLKKLLENEVLAEDTKAELTAAFESFEAELTESVRAETEVQVKAELTEQWVKDREVLVEAIDSKVGEFLDRELGELKEDVSRFRDLEAEYAKKLVEQRAIMAEELKDDMSTLIDQIDQFLGERIEAEFNELKEDIDEFKKLQFGRKIFESFATEFNVNFVDEDSLQSQVQELTAKLEESENKLSESVETTAKLSRDAKVNELLAPLNEYQREVMSNILDTTPTEKLDERFTQFVGRIVEESSQTPEKENETVLAEAAEKQQIDESAKPAEATVVVKEGNAEENTAEQVEAQVSQLTESDMLSLKRLSGIA
ncbi:MAG: hypothetical protein JXR12_01525 [Neptunomonas phycophila]|uniref:hypothetical protein n=1 Tax=Neptunomonas phycophila TaxID=1572645 RepID=UPI003B8CAC2B